MSDAPDPNVSDPSPGSGRWRSPTGAVADVVADGVFELDPDGRFIAVNDVLVTATGYSRDTLVGEHASALLLGSAVENQLMELDAEGDSVSFRTPLETADGERVSVSVDAEARTTDGDLSSIVGVVHHLDACEQQRTAAGLSQADEMVERVSDAFFALDNEWQFTYLNDQAERVLERDESDLLGETIWEEFPEAVGSTFQERYEHAMDEQEPVSFEAFYPPLDAWFEVRAYPSESGLTVYFQDVTERREREAAIAEREAQYRAISETAADGIVTIDADSTIEFANEAVEDIFGYDRDELLGESITKLMPAELRERHEAAIAQYLETGEQSIDWEDVQLPGRTADGERLDLSISFAEHEREDETKFTGIIRDITERKQRERALEQAEERFRTIFEQSQDAIYINDPVADEIVDVNPAGCDLLGYSREEILSRGPSDFHPNEMGRFREFVEKVFEEGNGWTDELTCLHREGERIPVEMSAARIELEGRPLLLAIVRDISDRKERERELERTERQFEATFQNPVSFMGLLDPDGTVRRINETALQFVDADLEDVQGEQFWETPWFTHDDAVVEAVEQAVERAADGEYVRKTLDHRDADGDHIVVDAIVEPVCDEDGEVVAILASGRDVTEREERAKALQDAYEIIADPDRPLDEQVNDLLDVASDFLGTDYGTFSRVDGEEYIYEVVECPPEGGLSSGERVPLSTTNCERVVETRQSLALRDVEEGAPDLADRAGNAEWGITSYLGAPVEVDDTVYGTFCLYDKDARAEQFSDWEVTFVELLSNWVGYEVERQRHAEELGAINELNEIVRNITEAAISEASREEIEQIATRRLARSDSYEFAWIGAPDLNEQTVEVRTEAGTSGYAEDISISLEEGSPDNDGPTARALQTGEIQTVIDIENDPDYEPWRESAREYGFRSSAAIPISHGDNVFAVLNLYADRPRAFEGEEQTVLRHLGESLGHAITAMQRKRALMGEEFVELEFRAQSIADELGTPALQHGRTTFEETVRVADDEFLIFGSFDSADPDRVAALAESMEYCESYRIFEEQDGETRFQLELTEPPVLSTVASFGGRVEEAYFEDGDLNLTVQVPTTVDTSHVIEAVQDAYPSAEVYAHRQIQAERDDSSAATENWAAELTDRQQSAVEAAFYGGYFEWPRETDGEELADSLGISSPTFHQHLRSGERKLLEAVLDAEDD